ncbi:GLUG motif-containing protein [Paenibacillus sp. 7516]|uniref:GLUG motif-containing protein n=1 Tax=Paenibacillus sp. 7516 TaxID=2022549 RepID=UPI000BA554DB|nr:GLUG motif-containing protein [Paenibacillus sp. 7516]PAF33321.1 hypothetical protein CHI14_02580 [Paenibacillus sp. 7516]
MIRKITRKISIFLTVVLVVGVMLSSFVWLSSEVEAASSGSGTASDPYIITTATQLNDIRKSMRSYYKLGKDIDLSSYSDWTPIGTKSAVFSGGLDGDGHTISGLTINRSYLSDVGLFGYVESAQIRNVHLTGVNIVGYDYVGSLVGRINFGKIENSSASGTVKGYRQAGGLVGEVAYSSAVVNGSSANVTVDGYQSLGGLIGKYSSWTAMSDNSASGNVTGTGGNLGGLIGYIDWGGGVTNSHASGDIRGTNLNSSSLGGLIGGSNSNLIEYSYATGNVFSIEGTNLGGLIGSGGGNIQQSYATGNITSEGGSFPQIGGLVGRSDFGKILNSYATGQISGNANSTLFGGLVGSFYQGDIVNSYAAVQVPTTGSNNGGLLGTEGYGIITNSYYDTEVANQSDTGKGEPKSTAEMKSKATFVDWDFNSIWTINEGDDYPRLRPYVKSYSVLYVSNGGTMGTVPVDSNRYPEGHVVTVLDNTGNMEREGYRFMGWSTDALGNGGVYKGADTFIMGTAEVKLYAQWAALTYKISSIEDETLSNLLEGYLPGTQETKTIPITRTGTGDLTNVTVLISGDQASHFVITGPSVTALDDGTPATSFTVRAKDNLPSGTYSGTVTVSADHMADTTFTVKQTVNAKQILKGDANGDGIITPADALMVTQHMKGKINLTADQFKALDMDNNGILNNVDVQMIMAIYLGGTGK